MNNNKLRITYGSSIMSQANTNKASDSQNFFSNDPNVRGIKGNELPISDARQTGSILGLTASSGALSGLVNIASIGGPGTWNPACLDGDIHPDNACVSCVRGKWYHADYLNPCSIHAPGLNAFLEPVCKELVGVGCQLCGPCYVCNANGLGNYTCDDPPGPGPTLQEQCLECNNDVAFCTNGQNPNTFLCTEGDETYCCDGSCIDPLKCYYTSSITGKCVPGCNPLLLDCAKCEFGMCMPGAACGECEKCDLGICVPDPDAYDNNGDPCSGYTQGLISQYHNIIP
jgi:hypothetical protein